MGVEDRKYRDLKMIALRVAFSLKVLTHPATAGGFLIRNPCNVVII